MLFFKNMENLTNTNPPTFKSRSKDGVALPKAIFVLLIIALIGAAAGFVLSNLKGRGISLTGGSTKTGKSAGIVDKKTFKDQAEGILREGGLDGEGNFHLERPGGVSQNVYLTSSTVDLSSYVGKKVRVWGQTFKAEKAGWLMDVGLVETL